MIHEELEAKRKAAKISKVKLARELGVPPVTVWRWLSGRSGMRWDTVERMREILNNQIK
jgi:transcriptional regulator with XRE-family HTH domain